MKHINLLIILCLSVVMPQMVHAQDALLRDAYNDSDYTELDSFFRRWEKEIPAIKDSELKSQPQLQQEAYAVFKAFYHPDQINLLGGSEWGDSIYFGVRYYLVQNEITVEKVESIEFLNDSSKGKKPHIKVSSSWYEKDTILNFRPDFKSSQTQPVYVNSKYHKILTDFLDNQFVPLGISGIMTPAKAKDGSAGKMAFLNNDIRIFYGHWGGYWQLETYPEAYSIQINKDLNKAVVNFRIVYEGGMAYLEKQNGEWKLVHSQLTWIE